MEIFNSGAKTENARASYVAPCALKIDDLREGAGFPPICESGSGVVGDCSGMGNSAGIACCVGNNPGEVCIHGNGD